MELLPHTREALDEYLNLADPDIESALVSMGDTASRIVPDCVGLSLTLYDHDDITFTLVASDLPTAELDAMQYLDDERRTATHRDTSRPQVPKAREDGSGPLDEERWAMFARASAAAGVASTLTLPIVEQERVVGGINVYASSEDAFAGRQGQLAAALGASAAGAVANADLSFETRQRAEEAPRKLRDERLVEVAIGILAAREALDLDVARERLEDAAHRAGISAAQAASVIIRVHRSVDDDAD